MRILLDNCVHRRAASFLPGQQVSHASEAGLAKMQNGALLAAAAEQFDLLITTDQNLRHQQNLERLPIAVLELHTRDTRLAALRAFAPHLPAALSACTRFRFISLSPDGSLDLLAPRSVR